MFPIAYPGITPVNTLIQGLTDYPHKSSFYENGKDLAGSPARQSRKILILRLFCSPQRERRSVVL
jgi:hypothetical protein